MDINNFVEDKIIANVKIGTKSDKGYPMKLSHFHVEKDKVTDNDMVDIFKQRYPDKPTVLKIIFKNENPVKLGFKRYVNGKAVCIGNGSEAITIGKDEKGNSKQVRIPCSKDCQQLKDGKCKVKCSLKFILDGIEAGGLWNLTTSGWKSARNIVSELYASKRAGLNIAGVPFELRLSEHDYPGYPTYYDIDLKRMDIKPRLVESNLDNSIDTSNRVGIESQGLLESKQDNKENINNVVEIEQKEEISKESNKETCEQKIQNKKVTKSKINKVEKENTEKNKVNEESKTENSKESEKEENSNSNLQIKEIKKTTINNIEFEEIVLTNSKNEEDSFILHPKANKEIINCANGSMIEIISSLEEMGKSIICEYKINKKIEKIQNGTNNQELKEAV